MPDHHTTIKLLGVEVPVTVSWRVTSYNDGGELEIERVFSDVLGEITDMVCNSVVGTGFTVVQIAATGWQDPIRAALFGAPSYFRKGDKRVQPWALPSGWPDASDGANWVYQSCLTETRIGIDGTLYALLYDEIWESQAFIDAVHEGPGDDEGDWY